MPNTTRCLDFSCIFFPSFSVPATFFHYFVIHSNNSVCICSAAAISYDMTRIGLSSTWEDNIQLWKENSSQSANMYNQGRIRRGFGRFSRAPPNPQPLNQKFIFMENYGYILDTVFTVNIHIPYFHLILIFKYTWQPASKTLCKIAGWVANSVDPDQTAFSDVWSGSTLIAQASLCLKICMTH